MCKKSTKKKAKTLRRHKNALGYIDPTVSGIDIGDKVIHVAIPDGKRGAYVKEFETTTPELNKIAKELKKAGVKTAVMEATGVYWVPLYEILESYGFEAVLVDAKSVKNPPGRKSDWSDCQWIQVLYSSGLLRPAFRPPQERVPLRQYVRQRETSIKNRQLALNRIEKNLQLMNIKLNTAVSDIGGVTGMAIVRAINDGEHDPAKLVKLRNRNCRQTKEKFIAALTGNYQKEHLFALKQAFECYDFANKQVEECDEKIKAELESFPTVTDAPLPITFKDKKKNPRFDSYKKPNNNDVNFDVRLLLWQKGGVDFTALAGIAGNSALSIFSELGGTDLSMFENSKRFRSWLKTCAGNNISGGKRRKSKKQPCGNRITQVLRMASLSAKRSGTYVGAYVRRMCGNSDKLKGIKAGANKIADMLFRMCTEGWDYHEKGAEQYEKEHARRQLKNLKKKARSLGMELVQAAA